MSVDTRIQTLELNLNDSQMEAASEVTINETGLSQMHDPPLVEGEQARGLNLEVRPEPMADGNPHISARKSRKKEEHVKLIIGTLNTRGYRTQNKEPKLGMIKRLMNQNKVAILALQETHLREEDLSMLKSRTPKLEFILSGETSNKEGVAFVINRFHAKDLKVTAQGEIQKGRVMWITVKWNEEEEITIINSHLPNLSTVGREGIVRMINKIDHKLKQEEENIIWLGDFNLTLFSSDRLPESDCDDKETQDKLRKVIFEHKLLDGWKEQNPAEIDWTFEQRRDTATSRARIDRIYCKEDLWTRTNNWNIIRTLPELSDHHMAIVAVQEKVTLEHGFGFWRLPKDMIEYGPFIAEAQEILLDCEFQMDKEPHLVQQIWIDTKRNIKRACQQAQKERLGNIIDKEMGLRSEMKKHHGRLRNAEHIQGSLEEIENIGYLLDEQERERAERADLTGKARFRVEGETMSKFYFSLNQGDYTKNIIQGLDQNGVQTSKLEQMAKIATDYHAELQKKPEMTRERLKAIRKMRRSIIQKLEDTDQNDLARKTDEAEIVEAIKGADNSKAPGKDGLTYEFYKYWMNKKLSENEDDEEEIPDIVNILMKVMDSVDETGQVHKKFNEGVMFLLYKKGDKTKIENYRPLTLLNTDYKIYTKTIATRLGNVAGKLLNEDQAGFVPGRSIYDQIKLTKMMIPYAEQNGRNGMIVSLDQEKAYDKIDHEYLWKILDEMNFPEPFTKRIKALYTGAKTYVMLNGKLPFSFKVERGVRQGDPLSCILFDLAIEPLGNRLRSNKKLEGMRIPGIDKRLIVTMFADDTLVFLSAKDKERHLNKTIQEYCLASTARYNLNKTSYIPVGTKEFRLKVESEGRMNVDEPIDKKLIVKEGESVRILGAWIGNNSNANEKWNKIVEESQKILDRWSRSHPSLNGKVMVINALVASRSWYLAMVNEMPVCIQTQLKKMFHTFLWNGKRNGTVDWEMVTTPRQKGGLGMVDIHSKLETMRVMWAKQWLNPTNERPRWAYIADDLISDNASNTPKTTKEARTNWALQNWNIIRQGKNLNLIRELLDMIKTIEKYNIRPDGANISLETKESMPAVYHRYANDTQLEHRKSARCLVKNHAVKTMKDLTEQGNGDCTSLPCIKMKEKLIENIQPKWSVAVHAHNWDNLDHTPRRKQKFKQIMTNNQNEGIVFNPDVTEKGNALETMRIFTERDQSDMPAIREPSLQKKRQITVYTDGSCKNLGTVNVRTGAGIWGGHNSGLNRSIRVPGDKQTNQRGELIAVMETLRIVPIDTPLKIKTDSKYVINGVCKHSKEWEDKGWLNVANQDAFKVILARLRERRAKTTFKWVKGHNKILGNERADELAGNGADKEDFDEIDWTHREDFLNDGARLSTLTFADVYGSIIQRERKHKELRRQHIMEAQEEVQLFTGQVITEEQIWMKMRQDPIPKNIGDFIWKLAHDRLPMGKTVMHYAQGAEWSMCKRCGVFETPEHMLWACQEGYGMLLWRKAKELWNKVQPNIEWKDISKGLIVGLGTIQFKDREGKYLQGATQLFKTLVSVTIWTIWTLRCKLVMANEKYDERAHLLRWANQIIQQYKVDMTIQKKYKSNKISIDKWRGNEFLIQEHPMTGKDYFVMRNLRSIIEVQ